MNIYIFDIDGTLADLTHRLHFIQQKPVDWDAFFKACPGDAPIQDVIDVAITLDINNIIIFSTGRSEAVCEETRYWLGKHGLPWGKLYMRTEGDHREDSIVKSELLDRILRDYDNYHIAGVFEDRQQVVDMYRARGLRVYQVAKGDF